MEHLLFIAVSSADFLVWMSGWLDALTKLMIPLGVLASAVFGFVAYLHSRTIALRQEEQACRLDRQARRQDNLDAQITQVALSTPTQPPIQ